MMRITNSMVVKKTKTNINTNRAKVNYTNNQMSSQKKITKPSDNPVIAIPPSICLRWRIWRESPRTAVTR